MLQLISNFSLRCMLVQLNLSQPKDLRSSLIQWINFVFLPEAVNRCAPPFLCESHEMAFNLTA